MKKILPAIIPRSATHLRSTLTLMSFAPAVQIDVVDGIFASPASWPYEPYGSIHDVSTALMPFEVEIDLMVENPVEAAREWLEIGVTRLVFHLESVHDVEQVSNLKNETGCTIGFSINNDTPLYMLTEQIAHCDFIQLMGIAEIGAQSQPFDDRVLLRIQRLKTEYPNIIISIDGSVNENTLPQLSAAGADRFVAGSAIFSTDDPKHAYDTLTNLVTT